MYPERDTFWRRRHVNRAAFVTPLNRHWWWQSYWRVIGAPLTQVGLWLGCWSIPEGGHYWQDGRFRWPWEPNPKDTAPAWFRMLPACNRAWYDR